MQARLWIASGAVLGAIAVAAGAFGAHILKSRLDQATFETFEVAVRYQMYHALALVLVGILALRGPSTALALAGALCLLGTLLFSGGLYGWVFTGIKLFVLIVPLGGMAWIAAWLAIAVSQLSAR